MANSQPRNIVLLKSSPPTLEYLTLDRVAEMLRCLNDKEYDPTFPWLNKECNPFVAIPNEVIEKLFHIIDEFYVFKLPIKKQMFKILLCKTFKKIDLGPFLAMQENILEVLKLIEATKSDLLWLGVGVYQPSPDVNIINAMSYLKNYLKTLPSLTYLDVTGICDDELLEIVGDSCPNLECFEIDSDHITSEGLKMLCMNNKNPVDQWRRCQKLQKIVVNTETLEADHLKEGFEALLLTLPQLRVLKCDPLALGKVFLKLMDDQTDLANLQLQEFSYDSKCSLSPLPHVICKLCPYLTTLNFYRVSNEELQRFEKLERLKEVTIWADRYSVNFTSSMVPFLKKMGKPIESLELNNFLDEINFNIIDEYCPNLKKLVCFTWCDLNGRTIACGPLFKKLELLYLNSRTGKGLQPIDCIRILSNCTYLSSLTVKACRDLDMSHLSEIVARNPLSYLTHVNITSSTLWIRRNKIMDLGDFGVK